MRQKEEAVAKEVPEMVKKAEMRFRYIQESARFAEDLDV